MFSVWQRPQIVWGGGDEAGSGGEGSKGRSKNEMKTQTKINTQLKESGGKFTPEINDLVAQRDRDRAATARNTAGTKYTGLRDMFDGGGPGASGPQFRGGPFSGVTNPFAGGGGGSGSTPTPAPRQRIGTKGMTSAQRTALTDAGYEVTKGGSVKKNGGTVAGLNFSGSREVNAIMNDGVMSGERGSFGDAFAEARRKAGGDGGTFTFGGETFTTNIDTAPKTSLRPKLRPDIVDYDSLYQDAAYGPGGIGAAPFGSYAPTPTPTPSSFDLDRALSTPFNIDDNIYSTVAELAEQQRFYKDAGLSADRVREIGTLPVSSEIMRNAPSILGSKYPPSSFAAYRAGRGSVIEPDYTTSFDDQSANFYTDPSASTAAVYPQAPDFSRESLGDRQRRRELAGGPTVFDGAGARSYDSAGIGDVGVLKYINDNLGTNFFQDQVFEDAPLVPENTVAGGGVDPLAETYVAPPPPLGLFEALQQEYDNEALLSPKALTYLEGAEIIPEARTAPLSDYDAYQTGGRLKPGFSRPLQARIETPVENAIEIARSQAREDARTGAETLNPDVTKAILRVQAEQAQNTERDPKTQAILDRNEARFLEQFEEPSQGGEYARVLVANALKGLGLTAEGLGDQANFLASRETTKDPIAERIYGGSPRGDIPTFVGDKNVVSREGDRFADTTDRLYERIMGSLKQETRDALEGEIFKDQNLTAPNVENLKMQAIAQLGTLSPIIASMVAGPLAVLTGSGMTVGDVNAQTEEYVRARYDEAKKSGADLGNITPAQLEFLIESAQRKATVPASVVGGATAGLLKYAPGSGGAIMSAFGEVLSEVGLEPSIAELSTAKTVSDVDPMTTFYDEINTSNLIARRPADATLMAAASGLGINVAASPPTNRANIPTKAADGLGSLPTFEQSSIIQGGPFANKPFEVSGATPANTATIGTPDPVQAATKAAGEAVVVPQPTNVQYDQYGRMISQTAPIASDKAAIQAASVKQTGQAKAAPNIIDTVAEGTVDAPTPLTQEQIANVTPEAALELDAALDVAPIAAEDAAPTQIDKNGLSRPENVSAAIEVMKRDGKNSASYLQRKLRINYSEASEINEQLEAEGYVSAKNKFGARKILTTDPTTAAEELISETAPTKPDSSVGAMDNRLRSALTQDLLRRDPNYSSYNEFWHRQINQGLKDADQNLSALPPDPRALELAQLNRDGPLLTGGVLRTYPTTGIDSLSPLANQLYTPEQRANMQRDRQIANAQREKARLEEEAMRPLKIAQNAILNSQSNVKYAENEVAVANELIKLMEQRQTIKEVIAAEDTTVPKLQGPPTPEFTTPQTEAQLSALTTPVEVAEMAPLVPSAIQSIEAQRAEMLAANKTYQDYINTKAQISALDEVTKEQAEREAFIDQQQQLLNAVNAEGGTAAITNAADNEIAKLEAQLNAVKEVIVNGKTPFPVNLPLAPYKTTGETLMEKAALTTPVEVVMSPLKQAATPESVGEADITPPTLAEFIEIQRAEARDGVPVNPLVAPVEGPPSLQEQLALDLQGGSAVATPEGIMSLVDRTSKAPIDAVNPVSPSVEEFMAKVAEAPTVRAPKDAASLVLTDPVAKGGIETAIPGRIPKDKLPTRFQSDLPVVDPFSRENQLARQAANRARFAEQENELAAAQGLTPASKPVGSTEVISRTDLIKPDLVPAENLPTTGGITNARKGAGAGKVLDPALVPNTVPTEDYTSPLDPIVLTAPQKIKDAAPTTARDAAQGPFFSDIETDVDLKTPTKDKKPSGIVSALKTKAKAAITPATAATITVPDIGELGVAGDDDDTPATTPYFPELPTDDVLPPEDSTGTGTAVDGRPYVVPPMKTVDGEDGGCPSGYQRTLNPSTGRHLCIRLEPGTVGAPSAPAEEAEEDEDGVVIDIPITERPTISPYYVPEMIESNYTPYVPGRRASTQ